MKTPSDSIPLAVRYRSGAWRDEFVFLTSGVLSSPKVLAMCGPFPGDAKDIKVAKEVFEFTLNLSTQRIMRVLPGIMSYPHAAVGVLAIDPTIALDAEHTIVLHFGRVCKSEREVACNADPDMRMLLTDIHWLSYKTNRVLFNLASLERSSNRFPRTRRFGKRLLECYPDEKSPEDVHQHIRDRQRNRPHKNLSMSAINDAMLHSDVLQKRGITCPAISLPRLAAESWESSKYRKRSKGQFIPRPKAFPKALHSVLKPGREYASPTVPGQLQSCFAWLWLMALHHLREVGGTVLRRVRGGLDWCRSTTFSLQRAHSTDACLCSVVVGQ